MKKFVEYIKKAWSIGGVIISIIGAFSLILFYNPSGFSYVDFMLEYNWNFQGGGILSMFIIVGAVILLTPIILDMPSAWKAAGFKGKFLFSIYLALAAGFMFVTEHYSWKTIVWVLELAAIGFMSWGGYVNFRDKRKFSKVGTSIEDSETTVDVQHDDD